MKTETKVLHECYQSGHSDDNSSGNGSQWARYYTYTTKAGYRPLSRSGYKVPACATCASVCDNFERYRDSSGTNGTAIWTHYDTVITEEWTDE